MIHKQLILRISGVASTCHHLFANRQTTIAQVGSTREPEPTCKQRVNPLSPASNGIRGSWAENSVIQLEEISERGYQYGPAAAGLGTSARNLPTVLELTYGPEPSEHLNLEIQYIGGEAVNCGADDIIGISSVQSEYGDPKWLVLWGPKYVQGGWVKQSRWSKVGPVRKEAKMAVKHVGTFDRGFSAIWEYGEDAASMRAGAAAMRAAAAPIRVSAASLRVNAALLA
ncbi:hypothetical protein DFH09DRAFT_1091766 [Mycena vulgaris]|nr:hypothetical protein DFH09DRAFT_1091766 [Mycena vulgaris]